jgi:hypothetical protein
MNSRSLAARVERGEIRGGKGLRQERRERVGVERVGVGRDDEPHCLEGDGDGRIVQIGAAERAGLAEEQRVACEEAAARDGTPEKGELMPSGVGATGDEARGGERGVDAAGAAAADGGDTEAVGGDRVSGLSRCPCDETG